MSTQDSYRKLEDKEDSKPVGSLSVSTRHVDDPPQRSPTPVGSSRLRNRIAFWFIGLCALSLQSFGNSVAQKALGSGDRTAVILLSIYIPQVLCRMYTDYWTNWFPYTVRIFMSAACGFSGLTLLLLFFDDASTNPDPSIWIPSRLCVIASMVLIGASGAIGEVTASGYTAFFERQCVNALISGAGFGSVLGAAMVFLKVYFQQKQVVLACMLFPTGLIVAYTMCLSAKPKPRLTSISVHQDIENKAGIKVINETDQDKVSMASFSNESASEQNRKGGMLMTLKLLFVDLIKYSAPLFSVYFLYNVTLSGFIGPSFDFRHNGELVERYENVFPYFVFTLRTGIFLGKSSGWMKIKKFYMFPICFCMGTAYCATMAYCPDMMQWFNQTDGGFWVLWGMGLPLGWLYGATPASVLFAIRCDVADELREFGLANATTGATFGQLIGNIVALGVAATVPKRLI